jgi:hypothetical protein
MSGVWRSREHAPGAERTEAAAHLRSSEDWDLRDVHLKLDVICLTGWTPDLRSFAQRVGRMVDAKDLRLYPSSADGAWLDLGGPGRGRLSHGSVQDPASRPLKEVTCLFSDLLVVRGRRVERCHRLAIACSMADLLSAQMGLRMRD